MALPSEKMLTLSCPGCGGRFCVPVSMAGRRGRCAKCGTVVIVVAPAEGSPPRKAAEAPPAADVPQYIRVECHVCQTLMYGGLDQIGQRLKCPDCGALTVVPPPPKAKVKRAPAALEGDQYEVWDADQQPLPRDLIAAQPVYIAVVCRMCETLMYATEDQVGQTLTCPDCGTPHVVPAPPAPTPSRSLLSDDAYAVDPSADPGERPPVVIPPTRKLEFEERQEGEYARALEKSRRTGKPMDIDARGRRVLPRWPLVTGILSFLFSGGAPVRWIVLSVTLLLGGWLFASSLSAINESLGAGSVVGSGMGAIMGVCFMVIAVIVGVIWAAAAASIAMTIVTESSEGNDQIQHWPPANPGEWFPDLLYFLIAVPVSAFPGWLVARLTTTDPALQALWIIGSVWVCLPLALLSELVVSSPWAVVSVKLLRGLLRRPFSALLFYVESAVLAAACAAATFAAAAVDPNLWVLLAPVYVAAGLIYSRLLGRLAWCVAEAGEPPSRG